ncbi:MAG: hypothetical protein JWR89_5164 [Tardiphaga sp.]|nr:hypothetical protein [Tardiphaga sp.]
MPRGSRRLLRITAYSAACFFLALLTFLVFLVGFLFLFAAFMLSTRLGYLRPALLAAFFAPAFFAGESFLDFLPAFVFGFGLSHGVSLVFFAIAFPPIREANRGPPLRFHQAV